MSKISCVCTIVTAKNCYACVVRLFAAEPQELYVIHYLGIKPWLCYRDYDCNWNFERQFASDDAHAQWFKVRDNLD